MGGGLELLMALAVLVVPLLLAWWLLGRAVRPRLRAHRRTSRHRARHDRRTTSYD